MWQRFTERARKVIFYAQEEAQKFGEGYISTEHILLGLIREPDSVAGRVLVNLKVSCERVREEVEKQLPRGDARPNSDMTLTPRAKRIIDLAYDEARNLGNNYIGAEHILLGAIRERDGLAGRVLEKLGVELEKARREVEIIQVADSLQSPASLKRLPPESIDPLDLAHIHAWFNRAGWASGNPMLNILADPGVMITGNYHGEWGCAEHRHVHCPLNVKRIVTFHGVPVWSLIITGEIAQDGVGWPIGGIEYALREALSFSDPTGSFRGPQEHRCTQGDLVYKSEIIGDFESGCEGRETISYADGRVLYVGTVEGKRLDTVEPSSEPEPTEAPQAT